MNWYWFGVLVAGVRVKLRQYHVRKDGQEWSVESWSKGISGSLWYIRKAGMATTFDDALAFAREQIAQWAAGYTLVDEGEPVAAEFEDASNNASGGASPDWWAEVLGVSPTADKQTTKSAFRKQAMKTHPDHGGTVAEFTQVYAAWEYIAAQRGW